MWPRRSHEHQAENRADGPFAAWKPEELTNTEPGNSFSPAISLTRNRYGYQLQWINM
jgi:hypothetical protein